MRRHVNKWNKDPGAGGNAESKVKHQIPAPEAAPPEEVFDPILHKHPSFYLFLISFFFFDSFDFFFFF